MADPHSKLKRAAPPIPASEWTEKIHGFLDPKEDKPEHFAAIGRLITAFNGIDVILNMILRAQIKAETAIGRAIIGSMRTGDMLDAIRRVAVVSGAGDEKLAELEDLRQDISTLKAIRDDVAHKVWAVKDDLMSFSNAHVSRRINQADFATYSIAELNEIARYAPYLSERALHLFPDSLFFDGQRLPSREKPLRLTKNKKTQGKDRQRGQSRPPQPRSSQK